jgi:hypothetical protein
MPRLLRLIPMVSRIQACLVLATCLWSLWQMAWASQASAPGAFVCGRNWRVRTTDTLTSCGWKLKYTAALIIRTLPSAASIALVLDGDSENRSHHKFHVQKYSRPLQLAYGKAPSSR